MTDQRQAAVALVDWGTSHLRVWLADTGGSVLAERKSADGMSTSASKGFASVLEENLDALGARADLPVMICGMAGARQGWLEAPYVSVPAAPDAIFAGAVPVPHAQRTVLILPGMAQRDASAPDVMRGEETQLAGIVARGRGHGSAIACMPGTHSKWAEIRNGRVERFSTWITGELFALLSRHSILAHSVGSSAASVTADLTSFRAGVSDGLAQGDALVAKLFGIRAATLLLGTGQDEAAARLSGLLIGAEIASATRNFPTGDREFLLIASGKLADLYLAALSIAGEKPSLADADEAVKIGLFTSARHHGLVASPEIR